jgi:ParB/RepB/Spo0J family partition protein
MTAVAEQVQVDSVDPDVIQQLVDRSTLKSLPMSLVRLSTMALRKAKTGTDEFAALRESIRARGVLQSIVCVERKDPQTGVIYYMVVDGTQRYTCAQQLGMTEIPANVVAMSDEEILETQIVTNVTNVATRPMEITRQIMQLLALRPETSISELATRFQRDPEWVRRYIALHKLPQSVQEKVQDGRIPVLSAQALSHCTPEDMETFAEFAETDTAAEFAVRMRDHRAAKAKADKSGKDSTPAVFEPKMTRLKAEVMEHGLVEAGSLAPTVLEANGVEVSAATIAAFKTALAWALSYDKTGQASQKTEWEQRQRESQEKAARRKQEQELEKARKEREKASAENDLSKVVTQI